MVLFWIMREKSKIFLMGIVFITSLTMIYNNSVHSENDDMSTGRKVPKPNWCELSFYVWTHVFIDKFGSLYSVKESIVIEHIAKYTKVLHHFQYSPDHVWLYYHIHRFLYYFLDDKLYSNYKEVKIWDDSCFKTERN